MEKLLHPGRIMFAAGILMLGILSIINKNFIVGRPPEWSASVNPELAYIAGALLIISAVAIITKQKAVYASLLIALLIFLFSVLKHAPVFMKDWVNAYKSIALAGAALIAAASFTKTKLSKPLALIGIICLAAFLLACGYAHFKWAKGVVFLMPEFIPFRLFWAYFAGVCLFAGGIGIVIPYTRKLAALLSGIMILCWFFLVHIPLLIKTPDKLGEQMGMCESFALSGIFFVLAAIATKRGNR